MEISREWPPDRLFLRAAQIFAPDAVNTDTPNDPKRVIKGRAERGPNSAGIFPSQLIWGRLRLEGCLLQILLSTQFRRIIKIYSRVYE